jgi:Na+/H+ antiporter NhaC
VYLSSEYYCQTPFTNIPAITYIALRLFLLPILFIALVYVYLLRHVRQSNSLSTTMNDNHHHHRKRSKQNKRDLIVIKRLLLMLSVLILLGLPSIIFLSIFMITGHLISLTYRIGWLSVSFSLVFLAYMLIRLTNPLKKTVRRIFSRNPNL